MEGQISMTWLAGLAGAAFLVVIAAVVFFENEIIGVTTNTPATLEPRVVPSVAMSEAINISFMEIPFQTLAIRD